jgi:hypothetical protein
VETSLPPSQGNPQEQPVRRVVVPREKTRRTKRSRTKKRLFLLFCVLFLLIVLYFISEG